MRCSDRIDSGEAGNSADPGDRPHSDKIYAEKRPRVADFVFDERVAAVFTDMIRRSVPGYETLLALLGVIAQRYTQVDSQADSQADSTIYDLGCSLGAAMLAMHARVAPSARFIGVDNSAAMLQACGDNLRGVIAAERLALWHGDVRDVELKNASLVVLNFTLQFLPPADRRRMLARIYAGLKPGGALVLAEKIRFDDAAEGSLQHALHAHFKMACGYSALEIAQKRAALEKVMALDSAAVHLTRLRAVGFSPVSQWFQAFNFCAFLALK